jgi:hypothetical protein
VGQAKLRDRSLRAVITPVLIFGLGEVALEYNSFRFPNVSLDRQLIKDKLLISSSLNVNCLNLSYILKDILNEYF